MATVNVNFEVQGKDPAAIAAITPATLKTNLNNEIANSEEAFKKDPIFAGAVPPTVSALTSIK